MEDINKRDLLVISDYFQAERYPGPKYFMPERDEITHSIKVAQNIIDRVKLFINQ